MKNASFPWHKLKDALLQHTDVTQAYALEQDWGWRLSARIHDLKKREWPIEARYDENGLAHYFLPKGWKPCIEKTPVAAEANSRDISIDTGGRADD